MLHDKKFCYLDIRAIFYDTKSNFETVKNNFLAVFQLTWWVLLEVWKAPPVSMPCGLAGRNSKQSSIANTQMNLPWRNENGQEGAVCIRPPSPLPRGYGSNRNHLCMLEWVWSSSRDPSPCNTFHSLWFSLYPLLHNALLILLCYQ